MARSKGAASARKANPSRMADVPPKADGPSLCQDLPTDVLLNIHDRLGPIDRFAFAAVINASCKDDVIKPCPYAPWLLLPGETTETLELVSITDGRGLIVSARNPARRGHLVLGSSGVRIATVDVRGQIYLVNLATGDQHELPHVSTTGLFREIPQCGFYFPVQDLMRARYGGHYLGPDVYGTYSFSSEQMGMYCYRKVVLSSSPSPGSYAAMLIMHQTISAPAFATAEDPAWRLAPSPGGVEDAVHHDGQFYSLSYTGVVEAWERDSESGAYTATAVAPRLTTVEENEDGRSSSCSKYLAVGTGGRLMVVIKHPTVTRERYGQDRWSCSFKVHVLGDNGQWKEVTDIGDVALFVGVNNSLCLPTTEWPQIKAGCVYFTGDGLVQGALHRSYGIHNDSGDLRAVGMYNLKDGRVKQIEGLGQQGRSFYTPPAWIMCSSRDTVELVRACTVVDKAVLS